MVMMQMFIAMDKVRGAVFFHRVVKVMVMVMVMVFISFSVINGNEEEKSRKASLWEWQRLRDAYSIYSAALSPTSIDHYFWNSVKQLIKQAYAHFFSPNIDFRRGDEAGAVTENGTGEKVKEALAKSLGTSKATLEDAAKSAADIAGETMHKVKGSFSEDRETKRQNEL